MSDEFLTAEQVLAKVDEYCRTKGNPALAPHMRAYYTETGKMAPAVLESLRIKPVLMWQRKP